MSSDLNSVQTLKQQSYRKEDVSRSVHQTKSTLLWSVVHITALEAVCFYVIISYWEHSSQLRLSSPFQLPVAFVMKSKSCWLEVDLFPSFGFSVKFVGYQMPGRNFPG